MFTCEDQQNTDIHKGNNNPSIVSLHQVDMEIELQDCSHNLGFLLQMRLTHFEST